MYISNVATYIYVHMYVHNWPLKTTASVLYAHRILIHNINCLEAHKCQVLNLLVHERRGNEAAAKIGELIHLVDRFEPKNHKLYFKLSTTLARLVGLYRITLKLYTYVYIRTLLLFLHA